jgi:hypothetical protein
VVEVQTGVRHQHRDVGERAGRIKRGADVHDRERLLAGGLRVSRRRGVRRACGQRDRGDRRYPYRNHP